MSDYDTQRDIESEGQRAAIYHAKKSAARYPEVDPKERARAERSAEIYGSGYLVLINGEWRSFCGEEVRIIKRKRASDG
jgi:hypothetical protein